MPQPQQLPCLGLLMGSLGIALRELERPQAGDLRPHPGPVGGEEGNEGIVAGVAFWPDGLRAVSAGQDRTARVWDPATGKELRAIVVPFLS